jgi:hypothetical protein
MDLSETVRRAIEGRYGLEREFGQGGVTASSLSTDLRHGRAIGGGR